MARSRLLITALAAVVSSALLVGLSACGSDDDGKETYTVEPHEVYLAVIHWELDRRADSVEVPAVPDASTDGTTDSTDVDDDLPVVYVAAADGSAIGANVQATVAHATVDEATVRFADAHDEALEMDDETQPVKDDGVLLSVAPIPPDAEQQRRVEVEVTVYRSLNDQESWLVSIDATGDGAIITSSTVQPS
jgi:hypothetical protein